MFLQKLPSNKRYTCYAFASIFVWISMIQCYKVYKNFRSNRLKADIVHNERQRKELKKKNQRFSASNHLNDAFNQYKDSVGAKFQEDYRYIFFSHHHLASFISEPNGLFPSMRNHRPILDADTASNLYIFKGPPGNFGESYCNKLCETFDIELPMAKYNLFMTIASANNDPERIKWSQKTIKALNRDEDRLYKIQSILREFAEMDRDLMDFYMRDKYGSRATGLLKSTIRAELLVQKFFLDLGESIGWDIRKLLEESKLGVWTLKMMLLHETDLEHMIGLDRLWKDLGQWWNTLMYVVSFKQINNTPRHGAPLFSTGIIYTLINGGFNLAMFIPDLIMGNRRFSRDLLDTLSTRGVLDTKSIVDWTYFLITGPFYFMKCLVKEPMDMIHNRIYMPYKTTPIRYNRYANATKAGYKLLKQFEKLRKLLKKLEKNIQKDDELAELLQPYLKPIKNLLHNRKLTTLRYVLREISKLPEAPITWWELLNPFNFKATNILRLVKKLDDLKESQEKAWMAALASACCLSTFVQIAVFEHENRKKKSKLGFSQVNILEAEDSTQRSTPKADIKGMYSILINPVKVVKNDFSNTFNPKTSEETTMILHGLNGSGKSVYMRTVAELQILFQAIGFIFADKADITPIDYLRFIANISDDQLQNLSLMMAEAKKIDQDALRLVDGMDESEKAYFFFDEPGRGTPSDESGKWVLSIIAYLRQAKNNLTVFSTHLTDLFDLAEKARYYNLTPCTPGFDPIKGFTYKVKPGRGQHPVSIYVLQKTHFHPVVLEKTIALLAEDETYRFRDKIIEQKGRSVISMLFDSSSLEQLLLLIFFLLLGMLLGFFIPTIMDRKRRLYSSSKRSL